MTRPFSPERWAFEITHVLNAAFGYDSTLTGAVAGTLGSGGVEAVSAPAAAGR